MNDYVERLCPVEMPESWTWVSLIEDFKEKEQDRRIREALASETSSLVRFAPEKGKIDCRLKRMMRLYRQMGNNARCSHG